MKKKIGVITYWQSKDNYGQVLQCFALQEYLRHEGYAPYLIRYLPIEKYTLWDKINRKIIKNLSLKRIRYIFSNDRKKHMEELKLTMEMDNKAQKAAEQCKFGDFKKDNIVSTELVYHTINELRVNPPVADAYICGSDQVWHNDLFIKNTAGWFLDFGNARRISYAASIGRILNPDEEIKFNQYLEKFHAISVREESALEICKKLGYKNAQLALDPTLLLERKYYEKLITEEKYEWNNKVFIYVLNVSNKENLHWDEIKQYANESGMNTEICCSSGYICARELVEKKSNLHLTVGDWLYAIDKSNAVVTSSFHGTVFSIIFHTPFVVIPLVGKNMKANDRIITLLNTVGLGDRVLTPKKTIDEIMRTPIDWNNVDKLIAKSRVGSVNFLEEALRGI